MKYRSGFITSEYSVNFTVIQHPKKLSQDLLDIIEKTYYAGFITKYGSLMMFGIGAERGTYNAFSNLHMQGIDFQESRNALTWFTDLYSMAQRNQGKTSHKTNFYLSQLQEILPVVNFFGIRQDYEQAWQDIRIHDSQNNLADEIKENGRINQWQTRTKLITIPLTTKQSVIQDGVVTNMLTADNITVMRNNNISNYAQCLRRAFQKGTSGLVLSADDLTELRSVVPQEQYQSVA